MRRTDLSPHQRIIVPLDLSDFSVALNAISDLAPYVGAFKVGYQLGYAADWRRASGAVKAYRGRDFLDVKLHDIGNTMGKAAKSIAGYNPWAFNVHATAGIPAIQASAAHKGSALLLAVTILTSLSEEDCKRIYGAGPEVKVPQLALEAQEAGADGVICSPQELAVLNRIAALDGMLRVTPGVRPRWADANDQKRVMTPAEAVEQGADFIVIGRPILNPPSYIGSPVDAAKLVAEEIRAAQQPAHKGGKISRGNG